MSSPSAIAVRYVDADGLKFFYREAGNPAGPVFLLLHGFPSSSYQYRKLLHSPLSSNYRLIAPDLPGFGFTEVPAKREYEFTFDNLAKSVEAFVDALALTKYALYIFDYGAPTGLRLALSRPEAVTAIVSQNGNAFVEGLGDFWDVIRPLWKSNNSAEEREKLDFLLSFDVTQGQYTGGEAHPELIAPETYTLDHALINRDGQRDIQLDLFFDYRKNIHRYPEFHDYFAKHQPPVLAVWGKNDPIFIPAGAQAFKQVLPAAQVELVDGGHFALENHAEEIAELIGAFFAKHNI